MAANDATGKEKPTSASHSETSLKVPFKHQHSFEERYAAIINQQILENTINKEVLQRQVQAFFPISRSSSRERPKEKELPNDEPNSGEEDQKKILDKLQNLDIKDKEQT